MDLIDYIGKKVYILTYDGDAYFGTVSDYFYPEENKEAKESIVVDTIDGRYIAFDEDDIRTIQIS